MGRASKSIREITCRGAVPIVRQVADREVDERCNVATGGCAEIASNSLMYRQPVHVGSFQ